MTAEEKGRKFLSTIGNCRQMLLEKLTARWGCQDAELLDDVFGEAAIQVYMTIRRRNLDLKNPEQYFLRSARTLYIRMEQKERRLHGLDKPTEEEAPY